MTAPTNAAVLDRGDLNVLGAIAKAIGLGSLLAGGGIPLRLVRESVAVASDAATPTFTVARLLRAKVSAGSAGNGEKACLLNGDSPVRIVREPALAVASLGATPTYPVKKLLDCTTAATGAPAGKICDINGATPGAGHCAPNSGGTALVFHAETTGTGTADVTYLTLGGVALPNSGGTSIAFLASEVTGASAVVDLEYLTPDPPLDANGTALAALTASAPTGVY